MPVRSPALLAVLAALTAAGRARAEEEVVVETSAPTSSAGAVTLDGDAIAATPGRSTDDLLRAMPGMQVSSHGGRGKAYQYLLRGFDAVHGADVAVSLEGVPLNEVSNIHGHGYLDLHFLSPQLLASVALHPGNARPMVGDFGTAASVDLRIGVAHEGALVAIGGGTDRSGRAGLLWRPPGSAPGNFVQADVDAGAGVTDGRRWRQVRTAWGFEREAGPLRWQSFLLGYDGAFDSPGVLRADDVAAGAVGFYDAYPGAGGGRSSRFLGGASVDWRGADATARGLIYAGRRGLQPEQNYTGWWRDPERGDATRQRQDAWQLGGRAMAGWSPEALGQRFAVRGGADLRLDLLRQGEEAITPAGTAWQTRIDATARQLDAGLWASVLARPVRWLDLEPGLRVDALAVWTTRRVDTAFIPLDSPATAASWAPVVAPKATVRARPHPLAELILAYGRGFRSPEARAIEDGDRAPVAIVDTVEAGATAEPHPAISVRGAAFLTFVSNEIVFDHLAGRYQSTGSTRRVGGEAALVVRPIPSLRAQIDVSYADGRYRVTRDPIPFAPRWMGAAGVYAEAARVGPTVWSAGLRARVVGPRPLPGGFGSRAYVAGDLTIHGEWRGWIVDLDLDNALFNRWRDGEFVFPSWWDRSGTRGELPVAQITAGDPTALRIGVGRRFGCGRPCGG